MWKVGEEEISKRRVRPWRTAAFRREDAAQSCEAHAHTQRSRQAAGRGAEHTLRTEPPGSAGKTRQHAEQSALGGRLWGPKFCLDLHTALHTLPQSRDPGGRGPRALLQLHSQHSSRAGSRPDGQPTHPGLPFPCQRYKGWQTPPCPHLSYTSRH